MLLLVVWIAVGVLAVVVLGSLAYLTLGALRRLGREATALDRDVRPVLERLRQAAARAGEADRTP
ncbi:hypothetical protein [Geodermatophilus sp. URMC 64]